MANLEKMAAMYRKNDESWAEFERKMFERMWRDMAANPFFGMITKEKPPTPKEPEAENWAKFGPVVP